MLSSSIKWGNNVWNSRSLFLSYKIVWAHILFIFNFVFSLLLFLIQCNDDHCLLCLWKHTSSINDGVTHPAEEAGMTCAPQAVTGVIASLDQCVWMDSDCDQSESAPWLDCDWPHSANRAWESEWEGAIPLSIFW